MRKSPLPSLTLAFLSLVIANSCASSPATRASVDKAYAARDSAYLDRVASGKLGVDEARTREQATRLRRELGRA